jgi:hypothetical protein
MSKQEERDEEIENVTKKLTDLKYEIRTQTGLIVLLMLLNFCTVVSCLAYIWSMISK